ncbi:DUF1671-domain-containing protein [Aspergillus egyptiacus]|nr:DUF1671-domain-containing protein [Aspergillus egyptiacus]
MDAKNATSPTCPFCPFFDSESNVVAEHIQYCHPEPGYTVGYERHPSGYGGELFRGCSLSHSEKMMAHGEFGPSEYVSSSQPRFQTVCARNEGQNSDSPKQNPSRPDEGRLPLRDYLQRKANGNIKRLGSAELGPYAYEKKMPSWLLRILDEGNTKTKSQRITPSGKLSIHADVENRTANVVPTLAQLCERDKSVQRVFFCSHHVHQISKMPREWGFCGYRNIQMLVSYLQESLGPGRDRFPGPLPTILGLQDMIEHAWDLGINGVGRAETGSIKGTRKYIGTSEVRCEASSIGKRNGIPAHSALLSHIAAYFRSASPFDEEKVVLTNLPPIYFQHHGHSMTVIGFEIRGKGSANILVFDPAFKTPSVFKDLRTNNIMASDPARILKEYRRVLNMRNLPNIVITGTPGVGKTVHCEQLAQDTGLRHLSINQVAKDRGCYDTYDEELETWVVDEDKLLDAIEDEVLQGGYLIDWHACDLFPKSWIDLVVVLRCPSTSVLYDRLSSRGYHETKLQENLDAEIFGVLIEEAREAFDEELVVELTSVEDGDVEGNCARILSWVESWKRDQANLKDSD